MEANTSVDIKRSHGIFTADILKHAHDFALLSEEESQMQLTKGHLVRDQFSEDRYACVIDFCSKSIQSTDLCSEFSAQCLLSSVANTTDHMSKEDSASVSTETLQQLRFTLKCLKVAKAELATVEVESKKADETTLFLALNLLVAIRDDEDCETALKSGGIIKKLKDDVFPGFEDSPEKGSSGLTPLDHLFILANRAHIFGMRSTAKALFMMCADELINTQKVCIINQSNTIGMIHRFIINLSPSVEEVISTFESVNKLVESTNSREGCDEISLPYSTDDIDYFVVEAHNRACSLTFIGDSQNAERLLTVSLNLLSYCGKEIESYGPEIRRTYRGVIGQQDTTFLSSAGCCDLTSLLQD